MSTIYAEAEIKHIGLYADISERHELTSFLKACGYNVYEILDHGFSVPDAERAAYHTKLAHEIDRMQAEGFMVTVLILSNMRQTRSKKVEFHPLEAVFSPDDEALMAERLDNIREAVKKLRKADAFVFFAGDPGGHPEADVSQFFDMAEKVKTIVSQEAPDSHFFINSWAIAAWDRFTDPFTNPFWVKEVEYTRELIESSGLIGPDASIVFPMHNYYRSLALRTYDETGTTPILYPSREEVTEVRALDVQHVWGWPYFLIDEIDDGYSGATYRQAQAELRYLYQVVREARTLGMDGLIGNCSGHGFNAEVINLYAFAQFCKRPDLTPDEVRLEFSAKLATEDSVDTLARVFAFIENHSSWEAGLPEVFRLPPAPAGGIESVEEAMALIDSVKPLEESPIPLPETPATYIDHLRDRLTVLLESENN